MKYFIWILLSLLVFVVDGQSLKSQKINEEDIKSNIEKKYSWQDIHDEGAINLILYKNHRFKFLINGLSGTKRGVGVWRVKNDIVILNTDMKMNSVPVEVVRNSDTKGNVDGFNISIPKDIKGNDLFDCMVRVNNDSTTCLPSYGKCDGHYTFIDSVKVVFGNGMSSQWVSVMGSQRAQIHITIQTDYPISSYYVLDNKKYKIFNDRLVPIDN